MEVSLYIPTPTEKCMPVMQQPNPIQISTLGKTSGKHYNCIEQGECRMML